MKKLCLKLSKNKTSHSEKQNVTFRELFVSRKTLKTATLAVLGGTGLAVTVTSSPSLSTLVTSMAMALERRLISGPLRLAQIRQFR